MRNSSSFELHWFTTQDEINLCGHATLAATHIIFEYLDYPVPEIHYRAQRRLVNPQLPIIDNADGR